MKTVIFGRLESVKAAVLKYGADIGIANDGDADRCLVIDEKGNELEGALLLSSAKRK